MTKETLLIQCQSEYRKDLKSVINISKPFEKIFMDTLKLFMVIQDWINFLQLGRYGSFSEQTCRNNFENEPFDCFTFYESITKEYLSGNRKAIDPFCIPKLGHRLPGVDTSGQVVLVTISVDWYSGYLITGKSNCRKYPVSWLPMPFSPSRHSLRLCVRMGSMLSAGSGMTQFSMILQGLTLPALTCPDIRKSRRTKVNSTA